ncbi:MAG: helix-turn-helix transcriptional regulator [Verrucomicrobiae bacterium]|nr:helix-turn-helix transcriptional regulator [Verrucomicrobiae bacterium]
MLFVEDNVIWRALADPTRREILETIGRQAATTGEIVEHFSNRIVRTAVMKHLDVLESARLIRIERIGRTRRNHIEREPLEAVAAWLEKRVQGHGNNLKRLKNLAETKSEPNKRL